jgi:F420-dependent oxidoreductase-like protein
MLTRFGLHFSNMTYPGASGPEIYARIADVALAAEENGFDSLWVPDHYAQNAVGGGPSAPLIEAAVLLGALAACTKRARLGMLVAGVTFRNPALLAKSVTSVDAISGGRAVLGIGAAWDADEHTRYGIEFPPIGERMDRLEETLEILKRMFEEETPSFAGRHYSIRDGFNSPRPVARIPILVGGKGEKRTLRIVARYADACNLSGDAATVRHKLAVLERHCAELGRDPRTIDRTVIVFFEGSVQQAVDAAGAMRQAGCDGVIFLARKPHETGPVVELGAALRRAFG